jgi:hypothetical protein
MIRNIRKLGEHVAIDSTKSNEVDLNVERVYISGGIRVG